MGAWIMAPFSVEDLREGRDGLRFLNRAKKAPVLATALRTTRANPLASLCLVSGRAAIRSAFGSSRRGVDLLVGSG